MALKLENLRSTVEPLLLAVDLNEYRKRYRTLDIPRADAVNDINKRYRWDLFRYAVTGAVREQFFDDVYSSGANDSHVDSLLKSIIPTL